MRTKLLSFPVARLADVVAFSHSAVAHGTQPWSLHLLWPLHVAPHCFVVRLLERVQFSLELWNLASGLSVVQPELDLVYLVADVPQLFLLDVPVRVCQCLNIRLIVIKLCRKN